MLRLTASINEHGAFPKIDRTEAVEVALGNAPYGNGDHSNG
ncbi:hypothetical protein [Microcystis aeruginosa]|nr:hypothetical protein [Microcystis aeruginosa]MDB9420679.1 hypothetical protein [Microcystis aeruginosa CS-563/04]